MKFRATIVIDYEPSPSYYKEFTPKEIIDLDEGMPMDDFVESILTSSEELISYSFSIKQLEE